jgi:hypothetical protein
MEVNYSQPVAYGKETPAAVALSEDNEGFGAGWNTGLPDGKSSLLWNAFQKVSTLIPLEKLLIGFGISQQKNCDGKSDTPAKPLYKNKAKVGPASQTTF